MACFCPSVLFFYSHILEPIIEEGAQQEHTLELEDEIELIESVKGFIRRLRSQNFSTHKIEYINENEFIEFNNNEHTYSVTVCISKPLPAGRRASV